jgi:hypothetical protein
MATLLRNIPLWLLLALLLLPLLLVSAAVSALLWLQSPLLPLVVDASCAIAMYGPPVLQTNSCCQDSPSASLLLLLALLPGGSVCHTRSACSRPRLVASSSQSGLARHIAITASFLLSFTAAAEVLLPLSPQQLAASVNWRTTGSNICCCKLTPPADVPLLLQPSTCAS